MSKRNRFIIIASIVILFIIFLLTKNQILLEKLSDGKVFVARTINAKKVGRDVFIEYVYYVNGIKYIGETQNDPFSKNKLIVPDGKYFVITDKDDPKTNVLIHKMNADTFKMNIEFTDIIISKSLLKYSLSNGGGKAKIVN